MAKGEHWIVDVFDFPSITAGQSLEVLLRAAKVMNATVVDKCKMDTENENVAMVIVDESHLAIHDYRKGYAALDIFTCGGKNMQAGFDYIKKEIGFEKYEFIFRGKRF